MTARPWAGPGTAARRAVGILAATVALAAAGWSVAWQSVSTEHVQVLFDRPRLETMARRAAMDAERALLRVAELFGIEPFRVVLTLDDATDVFNALATPVPRPTVALRAVPPLEEGIGLNSRSWLELVIVHELAHLAHFTGTGSLGVGLGLVGEGVAPPPPLWVTEGIATWVESELTGGGRRDDARTAGLLATLALGGEWPTLEEASTATHAGWPGGATRYLLGAAFLDALVAEHGWDAVVSALRIYARASVDRTFSGAWRQATGRELDDAWIAWRDSVAAAARTRRTRLPPDPERLTDTGWDTGLPSVSPSGRRVAWRSWPAAVGVARIDAAPAGGATLEDVERHLEGTWIESLDWLDEDTLVYTRPHPTAATTWSEIFSLDLTTGREVRWTRDARAHFVRAEPGGGCVRFVRARPADGSVVARACPGGGPEPVWTAPEGTEIVGFDVASDGRMVVSLWDRGTTGIAVLEPMPAGAGNGGEGRGAASSMADAAHDGYRLSFVTRDRFMDLDPVWTPTGAIRFRSDRTERFEIWEARPGAPGDSATLVQRTETLGGAFQPAAETFMVVLGAEGFDLAAIPAEPVGRTEARVQASFPPSAEALAPDAEPYTPWPSLAPFGWLPTRASIGRAPVRVAVEAQVYGQDATATHAYALALGMDTALSGALGPAYASVRWTYLPDDRFASFARTSPYTVSFEAGLWPHAPHLGAVREIALGVRGTGIVRARGDGWAAAARLRVGAVHLRSAGGVRPDATLDAVLTTSGTDRWGYAEPGVRVDVAGRWTATATSPSAGAWAGATVRGDAFGGSLAAAVRAGYRQQPPVPLVLEPLAASVAAEGRWHVPVALRYGDGRYALERITLTPTLRGWVDGTGVGIGADVAVGMDLLLSYAAPVTIVVQGGWSQRSWVRAGLDLGF